MNFIHAARSPPRLVDDPRAARLRVMTAIVHTGGMVEWLTPDTLAAPWWRAL
jgi:hypothetical protein